MSVDRSINPEFFDWNTVYVWYCDGGSYLGNANSVETYANQTMYFRGRRILETVVRTLNERHGMSSATDIVLSGSSAGVPAF